MPESCWIGTVGSVDARRTDAYARVVNGKVRLSGLWVGLTLLLSGCMFWPFSITPRPDASPTVVASSAVATPSASAPASVPPPEATFEPPQPTVVKPTTDLHGQVDGYLTAVDAAGRVSIDVVQFFSGAQAIKEAAARKAYWEVLECPSGPYTGGSTKGCSIPNDYLIVNENPRIRVLPLSGSATIQLIDWDNCCDAKPATRAELAARVSSGKVLAQIVVDDAGRITSVHETYLP